MMNRDFVDLLQALLRADARFLIVGAHALAVHGIPRATGDLDVWIDASPENAKRVWTALLEFGAPTEALGISATDLQTPGTVVQIGLPPRRIDLLTSVSGLSFEEGWKGRVVHLVDSLAVPFLGRRELILNKRATGRTKDLADLERIERSAPDSSG
jgi:hypothetical protein